MGLGHFIWKRTGPPRPKPKKAGYLRLSGRKPFKFTNKERDQRCLEDQKPLD
jgi:hypothetical protein